MKRHMKSLHRYEINFKGGYVALMSVIILGVVGVLITTTLYMTGIESVQSSDLYIKSYQAKTLADACAEISIQKIINVPSTLESGNLVIGNSVCSFAITNGFSTVKYILSSANIDNVIRKVSVIVDPAQTTPSHTIKILSWQENP